MEKFVEQGYLYDFYGELLTERQQQVYESVVLEDYSLSEVAEDALSKEEQMCLVDLAFKTIEADKRIEYSEVKFFKKIRVRLSLTDEEILAKYPDKEDFLLPDINVADDPEWNNVTFAEITLSLDKDPLSLDKEQEAK